MSRAVTGLGTAAQRDCAWSAIYDARQTGSPQGRGPRWSGITPPPQHPDYVHNDKAWRMGSPLLADTSKHIADAKLPPHSRTLPGLVYPRARPHTMLDNNLTYKTMHDLTRPRVAQDILWNNVGAHGAPEYGRDPQNREVPILVERRRKMWDGCNESRNLFRSRLSSRLTAIERSLDPSMISAQRVPTTPSAIIQTSHEMNASRNEFGQRRRDATSREAKHLKPNRRFGASAEGRVMSRSETAHVKHAWARQDGVDGMTIPGSPTDVTVWLDKAKFVVSPFVDS